MARRVSRRRNRSRPGRKGGREEARTRLGTDLIVLLFLVLAAAGVVILALGLGLDLGGGPRTHNPPQSGDSFEGTIVNTRFSGSAKGQVLEDRDCHGVGNGLTRCTAVIRLDDGRELHFTYTHDMQAKGCLSPNDRVSVDDVGGGTARVTRL